MTMNDDDDAGDDDGIMTICMATPRGFLLFPPLTETRPFETKVARASESNQSGRQRAIVNIQEEETRRDLHTYSLYLSKHLGNYSIVHHHSHFDSIPIRKARNT